MKRFIELETLGIKNSYEKSFAKKKEVIVALETAANYFAATELVKEDCIAYCKTLSALVYDSIDKLQYNKDSVAGSFQSSILNEVNKYFFYKKNNPKEEARFAKQTAKREALIAKGKNVDWKVVPKVVYDLDMLKGNILLVINRLKEKYINDVASVETDFSAKAIGLIDYFKEKASQAVYTVTKRMAQETAIRLMDEVGIPEPRIRYNQYPFEFSGGMRQRIVIAIALAANPDILICDEPTTALDVTIQAQILELINKLKKERNLSVIFITHDLGVVANMADRIAVMYAGKIVERGTADDVFYDPRHPYTWALLSSMPDLDTNEKLDAIPGTPPNMIYPPKGDAFAARNKYALKIDFEEQPPEFKISDSHAASTWLLHPDAPKVDIPKIITDRIERMEKSAGGEDNE
jgi:oligopeptide/dipeptide ABC transporter ATP-binding protein